MLLQFTVFVCLGALFAEAAPSLPSCEHDEYVGGTTKNPLCLKCPLCEPGHGLNDICNNKVQFPKENFVCRPCGNETFSAFKSVAMCDICREPCSTNEVETQQCSSTTNRLCSCKAGMFEHGAHGQCDQQCCHCIHGTGIVKKCQEDNVDGRLCEPPGATGKCPPLPVTSQMPSTEVKANRPSSEKVVTDQPEILTHRPSKETTGPSKEETDGPSKDVTNVPLKETTDVPHKEMTDVPLKETTDVPHKEMTDAPPKETTNVPHKKMTDNPPKVITIDEEISTHATTISEELETEMNIEYYWIYACVVIVLFSLIFGYLWYCNTQRRRRKRLESRCIDDDFIWMDDVLNDPTSIIYAGAKNLQRKPLVYKPAGAPPVPTSPRPTIPFLEVET